MPQVKKKELEPILTQVEQKSNSDWMKQLPVLGFSGKKVAHFGCANGSETMALVLTLDASEVIGIDKDVSEAKIIRSELEEDIYETKMALQYASKEELIWWKNCVPDFIKEVRLPTFIKEDDVANPAKPFQLQKDYFDLACCSNFLYCILEKQGLENVRKALLEMARTVKINGWIVADEPDNGKPARFLAIFEDLNLELIESETYNDFGTRYYFKKVY